jgi:hypothetical protein
MLHEDVTDRWAQGATHGHAIFLLEESVIDLKISTC